MSAVISDETSGPHVAEFFSPGPGERLRAARLSKGFDLAKVASELHLTTAVVEQLEKDEYEHVGARVFVRGYLRNYARIVDMPSESVLRQFDEKWPDDPGAQTKLRESPRLPADGGPSRGWARAITWFLVVVAAVLFLMWWRGYLDQLVPEQSSIPEWGAALEPAESLVAPDGTDSEGVSDLTAPDGSLRLPTLVTDPTPLPEPGNDTAPGAQDGSGALESPASNLGPLPTLETDSEGADSAESTAIVDDVAAALEPAEEGGSAMPSLLDAAIADPEAAVSTTAPAQTGVVMRFNAPCWVDVRDSSRKFKLFGEMPKGTERVLGGEPPYKFVIGNARAVEISVNGEPFDFMPFAKGNVARFTLDP
jgi:cytoskeleton protein RodZ